MRVSRGTRLSLRVVALGYLFVLLLVAFLVLLVLRLVAGVQQRREEKAP